jgi:tripartite-type tricarboxylate transporter receptor subunit TctC
MPPAVVSRLSTEFIAVVHSPEFTKFLGAIGMAPYLAEPQAFAAEIVGEFDVVNGLIRKLGVSPE